MKKFICIIASAFIFFSSVAFAAPKKNIVCVSFPEYDWVMNVLGSNASGFNVTLLQNKGTDLHSYQPSFADIVLISNCDLFVYVGGESDKWVSGVLVKATNKNMQVVNLMETLGQLVKEEELVEGMQGEEEQNSEDDEEGPEYDEHVWLSLKNAAFLTQKLCECVVKLDSANASLYKRNADTYIKQLNALDVQYRNAVNGAAKKVIVVGDRFPFRYLADEYGLKYYAAFAGCSAESEASFETVIFLAKKMDELGVGSIITIEKGNRKLAQTIVKTTKAKNQQILELDSLQSITDKDIKAGKTYLSTMQKNLEVLKEALR